ncbi:MAG: 4Fe-4S binding protein [Desulfobacterales bacterium]|nr:MAG: 4Fe-4S binding protein [Desulfobacterales bacterium]UCD89102.1 MAG: 4Fe-4S binding protein [Desulfobacterales bacterium]
MPYKHIVDNDRCKGCELCVTVCPKNVLELCDKVNAMGYFPVYQARPEDCVYCTTCCIMCPDVAIAINKTSEKEVEEE